MSARYCWMRAGEVLGKQEGGQLLTAQRCGDKKARSEGALCKGEQVGRDGKPQWALKHGK